jgi:hypothetical protein
MVEVMEQEGAELGMWLFKAGEVSAHSATKEKPKKS